MKKLIMMIAIVFISILASGKIVHAEGKFLMTMQEPDENYKGKKVKISGSERETVKQILFHEKSVSNFVDSCLVAQTMRDRATLTGKSVYTVATAKNQYASPRVYPSDCEAFMERVMKYIFDDGNSCIQHYVNSFYAPDVQYRPSSKDTQNLGRAFGSRLAKMKYCLSVGKPMHEDEDRAEYLLTSGGHKYYLTSTYWSKSSKVKKDRLGYNMIIYDIKGKKAYDKKAGKDVTLEEAIATEKYVIKVNGDEGGTQGAVQGNAAELSKAEIKARINTAYEELEWTTLNQTAEFDGLTSMSLDDRLKVEEIQKSIDNEDNESSIMHAIRVGVLVFGIALGFYSLLLIFSYLFDRFGTFLEFSLLGVVTLGFLNFNNDTECTKAFEIVDGKRYVSLKGIISCVGVCLVFSTLITSGLVFKGTSTFINWLFSLRG